MTSVNFSMMTPEERANWRDPMIPEGFELGTRLPPQGWNPQQPYAQQPQQNLGAMANISQIPGQMTGFGEQMTGFGETLGGYGEQMGGFGEQLGGFKSQFENIDSRLQNMEQGITSLTDKMGVQQQPQNPFQMYGGFGGYNPYSSGYGGYSFFNHGGEVENPGIMDRVKGFVKDARENWFAPKQYEGGDDPEYMKLFNFFWEKGYDQQQIDDIIDGKVDPTQIVPSRQKMDAEGNVYIDQEPFRGAKGGIVDVLESLRPRMAGGGIMDFTRGGHAMGPGTGTSDSIPAFLSDGEFVMTADAVKGIGGGNRQQGAQKLYGMMKKAEASA